MVKKSFRIEQDSMGNVKVPMEALYGAQTQRAIENFRISELRFPRSFINALGLIKRTAAVVNEELGLLDSKRAVAIQEASKEVEEGRHDSHFPVDIFQTGSGTSTNMNVNEVIAHLATERIGEEVHPNDLVNMSQSSNDVIPTAIHISTYLELTVRLLPALHHLREVIEKKASHFDHVTKTGRTHLMDAMPIRLSQELSGWSSQVAHAMERLKSSLPRLAELAQGGTAIGTGINADARFGEIFAEKIAAFTKLPFVSSSNYFESISSQDTIVEISGQLKGAAVSLMKISNDLRWMNSGPQAGLGEIFLPALQPGSSVMPGKVNPVIPEAVAMVCTQVIGNDVTITLAGQAGNFQLNVMLPVIAYNILQSISLLTNACSALADQAIAGFTVNEKRIEELVNRNPVLVTALNPSIGYEKSAKIAERAYAEGRTVKEIAVEMTDLPDEELDRLLDPKDLTQGGIRK